MIRDFFKKDINRNIETVIKADDRENIATEISEYVVTEEISKKITDFFSAYNNYAGANGVWISGYFGSGKSHLLKILSYVLENKEYDGYHSGELFAEKVEDDAMLKADIIKATKTPSESVLFNIDQQAQITSKADANAILSVFYKVFYDHLGYYGFRPHVAEFEMWLDKQKIYEEFKIEFNKIFTKEWEEARIDYFDPMVTDAIAEVLANIHNQEASKYKMILDEIESRQKQSIEDFCIRVNDYINTKPKGFRLNFFVDEVGQYISDNTKLMLNLQTVAETLATKTNGNAWILVTSQEDMDAIVGELNKAQKDDFSRIQARFKIKIPLTSANLDEVIEKRLLDKNDKSQILLEEFYQTNQAHLQSLLSFSEAGVQFKGYEDDKDFANKYPFPSYQFDLFQQCRIGLSKHNAFQGKHSSVGERSMLGVFQQVIKEIEEKNQNALVSFDLMFEGIKNELRGYIQNSIILAERNLTNSFEIKVLKTLFLVKYYDNFKTTKRNVSALLIDDMEVDLKKHDEKIEEALTVLENQNYIQRNGDLYEFLTDDERDIEEEIKNTDIDEQAVTTLLKEILFDEIIGDNRIIYDENKQAYDFTSKINGVIYGREKELEIELITDDFYNDEGNIQSQTMGTTSMKLLLSPVPTFMRDVRMFIKTIKYEMQNRSVNNSEQVKRILQEKLMQNNTRKINLKSLANTALAEAKVFVNGSKLEMSTTADGKTKVFNAFQQLVASVYPNLRMLRGLSYSEDSIKSTIHSTQEVLFKGDDTTMSEAETEIINLINRRKRQNDRTSLNDVKTEFSKKPYGWYPNAIWTYIAKLYKRAKVELTQNSNSLENEEVLNAILNSANHGSTLLEIQANFDATLVNKLKETYKDAFDESCSLREAKEVANAFKEKLKEMSIDVSQLLVQRNTFPFVTNLQDLSNLLDKLTRKRYVFFLEELSSFEDELLDAKEDVLDPIKRFINGEQANIYNDIKKILDSNNANFDYIKGDELDMLNALIKSNTPYKGNAIQLAKAAKDNLTKKVLQLIDDEKEKALTKADNLIENIKKRNEFSDLENSQQKQVLEGIERRKEIISKERFISNILQSIYQLNDLHIEALNLMQKLGSKPNEEGKAEEPKAQFQRHETIHVDFDKKELKTKEDVLAYIEVLKEAYLDRINNNIRINL